MKGLVRRLRQRAISVVVVWSEATQTTKKYDTVSGGKQRRLCSVAVRLCTKCLSMDTFDYRDGLKQVVAG